MDESVPHPGDLLPFDRCNLIAYLVRDFLGRFAYNFNATYEGALLDLVTDEGFKGYVRRLVLLETPLLGECRGEFQALRVA
jgi:hypothetical protein